MAEFELQGDPFMEEASTDFVPRRRSIDLDAWKVELRGYLAEMQKFEMLDPVEVFMRLSAFSARASEIRFEIVQADNRRLQSFRTQAIDPFIEECDRQFRIHSRIQATREMEFRMAGGHA